ncbi:MAG: hypothetical protein ABJ370_17595 [Paracoccaceae bacterium]
MIDWRTTFAIGFCVTASVGNAHAETAWEMFVARCLDPYENLALAIHDGLNEQPADQMRDAETVFGPSSDGYLLVLNAAPEEGDRACAVHDPSATEPEPAYLDWIDNAMQRQLYVPVDGMLSSNEWIEPQLQFEARFGDGGAVYEVIETELES